MPRRIQQDSGKYDAEITQYDEVISRLFHRHYQPGQKRLFFEKDEIDEVCQELNIRIRNIPDIPYTYRVRRELPADILKSGNWAIESTGKSSYAFRLLENLPRFDIQFRDYEPISIFNAIPEVVDGLLRHDEQSLLTKILYNRLIDIFAGLTCFHIQNHYRSFVDNIGEVELDAIYVGVSKAGELFVIPVEAKSQADSDMLGRIQISQMAQLVKQDFPQLARRILAVKELFDGTVGIVEFNDRDDPDEIKILSVARYKLIRRGS
jgi:hypothetical protein